MVFDGRDVFRLSKEECAGHGAVGSFAGIRLYGQGVFERSREGRRLQCDARSISRSGVAGNADGRWILFARISGLVRAPRELRSSSVASKSVICRVANAR